MAIEMCSIYLFPRENHGSPRKPPIQLYVHCPRCAHRPPPSDPRVRVAEVRGSAWFGVAIPISSTSWENSFLNDEHITMAPSGKHTKNHRKTRGKWWKMEVYPLVNVHITNWKITMLLMGKLTISTGPFSSSQTVCLPFLNDDWLVVQ